MGCYGYLCRGCGKAIRGDCVNGGELCVLIHIRQGIELGRTTGHYNEYGGVIEDDIFESTDIESPNSHDEVCNSKFNLIGYENNYLMDLPYEEYIKLQKEYQVTSGIVAWHKLCYDNVSEEEKTILITSKDDPNQSWGKIRKRFK